jgi:hypothetical protein
MSKQVRYAISVDWTNLIFKFNSLKECFDWLIWIDTPELSDWSYVIYNFDTEEVIQEGSLRP